MNMRRRPTRSAIRPAATRNAANTMLYAFRIHDSEEIEVPGNDLAMLGNAMLTIVASTNATAAPRDAITSTVTGEGPRRLIASGSTEPRGPAAPPARPEQPGDRVRSSDQTPSIPGVQHPPHAV